MSHMMLQQRGKLQNLPQPLPPCFASSLPQTAFRGQVFARDDHGTHGARALAPLVAVSPNPHALPSQAPDSDDVLHARDSVQK